jgi:hypothetical protein
MDEELTLASRPSGAGAVQLPRSLPLGHHARDGVTEPLSQLDGRKPTLLFIHGTALSTDGGFGGLWEDLEAIASCAWRIRAGAAMRCSICMAAASWRCNTGR